MRRQSTAVHVALLVVCACLLTTFVHAQYRGSIRGTVTDPQGAVVPGATVTLLNTDTNLSMTATSDDSGIYVFNALPSAHYKITVEHPGFKTKVLEHVQIIPDQLNALDLQIEVGQVSETVTVTGTTETVDSETATVSGTIRTKEIETLPSVGRNVFMLLQLAPGVLGDNSQGSAGGGNSLPGSQGPGNPGFGSGVNSGIFATENGPQVVAGGLGYQHNGISLDGISTVSAVWGGTSIVTPSEEAVAEVKVVSNSYDSEDGRFSGAQVQVTSKSGSNQPHGSFFFTAHRPGLDAYQKWNGVGGQKVLRDDNFFSQFGGSLGAPIWKNKVFGFFSWETVRTPTSATTKSTAWMETADFQKDAPSGSIAAKYLSFPGSIPSNPSINDISCATVNLSSTYCTMIPGKGLDVGSPLTTALGTQDPGWVSNQNPGFGSGLDGVADIAQYNILNHSNYSQNQYIGRVDANLTQKDRLSGSIYWVPQSSTNSGTRAYNLFHHNQKNNAFSAIWNRTISPTFVNELRVNAAGWRWNEVKDNPQSPTGLPADNFDGFPIAITQFGPNVGSHLDQWTYTYKDVATKVISRHTIKFGGEVTRLFYLQDCEGCAVPHYNFYNIWDFLNDAPNTEGANADPTTGIPTAGRQDQRENIFGFFVQDDYKLRNNLTVNLGLRWSYFGPLYSKENNMYRAVPGAGAAFLTGLNVVKGNSWNAQRNNFSPQIGFAWSPTRFQSKLVFRGGFGINYNQEEIAISSNISNNPGLTVNYGFSSAGLVIDPRIQYVTAQNLHSLVYPSNPNFKTSFGSNGLPTSGAAVIFIFPQDLPTTRVEHWSGDMQYEFLPKWTGSLSYQGSHSAHVIANAQIDPYAAANGFALNRSAIIGNSWSNYWNSSGYGNYNAMIAELKTSSWRGLLFDTQFTWSKNMDTNTGPYTEDIYPYSGNLNYAPSDNNVTRAWKLYGSYSPKFFAGRQAWMGRTLGGWTITGIFNAHTGFPWTPTYSLNLPNGGGLYCGNCWYGNVNPTAVTGAGDSTSNSAYQTGSNFGGQAANHLTYFTLPTVTTYDCNPTCTYGNANPPAGMQRNSITGPGYRALDMSLTKAFGFGRVPVLGEGTRLEFRVDAYNVFNNLNLKGGNGNIDRNIRDGNFGTSNGALGARVVTLGARFQF